MKSHHKTLSFLAFLLCFFSCKKEQDFTKYPEFPIDLSYEITSSGLKLKWTKIQTSDFVQYFVMRSTANDTIGNIPVNTPVNTIFPLSRITDASKTEFIDPSISTSSSVTTKLTYRVFAQLGNRFISSRNVSPFSAIPSLNAIASDVIWLPKTQTLFLLDKPTNLLHKIDLEKDTIAKTVKCSFTGSQTVYINGGLHNGVEELYVPQIDRFIHIFDPLTLEVKDKIAYSPTGSVTVTSVISDNNGMLFTSFQSSPSRVSAISRSNKNIITEVEHTSNSVRLKKMSGNILVGAPILSGYIQTFNFDPTSKNLSIHSTLFQSLTPNPDIFEVFPDGNSVILGGGGLIYNKDLQFLDQLSNISGNANYSDFAFSPDGKKLYAVNSIGKRQIDVFNSANLSFEKSIPIRTSAKHLVITDKKALVFSLSINPLTGQQITLIEKVDL